MLKSRSSLSPQAIRAFRKKLTKVTDNARRLANEGSQRTLETFKTYCDRIMEELAENKETANITGNQADAFGYAIFFDGKLVYSGYLRNSYRMEHVSASGRTVVGASKPKDKGPSGRSRAKKAIAGYVPTTKRGYEIFITNAMWYSYYQQRSPWLLRLKRPYIILSPKISPAWQELQDYIRRRGFKQQDVKFNFVF